MPTAIGKIICKNLHELPKKGFVYIIIIFKTFSHFFKPLYIPKKINILLGLTFVNSHHSHTNSKGYFVPKIGVKDFLYTYRFDMLKV